MCLFALLSSGPNRYEADPMTGKTVRSGKRTGPSHSLKGRTQVGAFHEDLAKVMQVTFAISINFQI